MSTQSSNLVSPWSKTFSGLWTTLFTAFALLAGAAFSDIAGAQSPTSTAHVVGYFPSWGIYARGFEVAHLPGDRLTHVNYAFANIANGECSLGDPWADVERRLPGDPWSGPGSDAPYFGNFRQLDLLQ